MARLTEIQGRIGGQIPMMRASYALVDSKRLDDAMIYSRIIIEEGMHFVIKLLGRR